MQTNKRSLKRSTVTALSRVDAADSLMNFLEGFYNVHELVTTKLVKNNQYQL